MCTVFSVSGPTLVLIITKNPLCLRPQHKIFPYQIIYGISYMGEKSYTSIWLKLFCLSSIQSIYILVGKYFLKYFVEIFRTRMSLGEKIMEETIKFHGRSK